MDTLDLRRFQSENAAVFKFSATYPLNEDGIEGEATCEWRIKKSAVGLKIDGDVSADVLDTNVSGDPVPVQLDFEIREKMVFDHLNDTPAQGQYHWQYQDSGDDCYESIDEFGVLDLKDLVRQYLILELASYEGGLNENLGVS